MSRQTWTSSDTVKSVLQTTGECQTNEIELYSDAFRKNLPTGVGIGTTSGTATLEVYNDNTAGSSTTIHATNDGAKWAGYFEKTTSGHMLDAATFYIGNDGLGAGTHYASLVSNADSYGNLFLRNLPSANTDGPVMKISQSHAGDDQAVLELQNIGPSTTLIVDGATTSKELSVDPSDPDEGCCVQWLSDGTGSGDDGDIMIKITAGGVTKTTTLVDFSAI